MTEITEEMIERAGRALCELGNQRERDAFERGVLSTSRLPAPMVYEEWREAFNTQALVTLEAALRGHNDRSTSNRGYDQFLDDCGADIAVVESSRAQIEGEDRGPWVWIMVSGGGIRDNNGAAHLDPEGARRVRDALDTWLREIVE